MREKRDHFNRAALTAFFLLCSAAGQARAQQALLWVPSGAAGAIEIIALLESDRELRLTAALPGLPAELEARAKKLEEEGRLEIALRPAGDPPLPLLYYPARESVRWEGKPSTASFSGTNTYFLGLRFGLVREAALRRLKKIPAGLVVPPGGLVDDYFPLAKALGVKWLACGPLASTAAAVFTADGLAAVPFAAAPASSSSAAGLFLVFDETAAQDPAALRALLAAELKDPARGKKLTVTEALRTAPSSASDPAEIASLASPWNAPSPGAPSPGDGTGGGDLSSRSGDYTRWAAAPAQRGALAALARTRADLMLHLNACLGDYAAAKPAFDEYFSAEEGGKLLALASADPETARETEIEMLNALGNAYRLMKKTPPAWLFSSLAEADSAAQSAEQLQISVTPGGFEIKNIERKPQLTADHSALPKTADPYKIWKLDRLKVEVLPDTVVFRFYPLEIENSRKLPSGFDSIALDLYIDVNQRPRAGTTRLLAGRPYRPFPENAWEYALEINPHKASLYLATAKGPAIAATVPPKAADGAITVSVPRSALKGNPLVWAYSALMLEPVDAKNFAIPDYIAADISNGYIYALRPGRK